MNNDGTFRLTPAAFRWLIEPTYWTGASMIWHTRYEGQPVTVLQILDVGSTYDFTRIYVSKASGWPVAYQNRYGDGPVIFECYDRLKLTPKATSGIVNTPVRPN